jgi:hypothetical protein
LCVAVKAAGEGTRKGRYERILKANLSVFAGRTAQQLSERMKNINKQAARKRKRNEQDEKREAE